MTKERAIKQQRLLYAIEKDGQFKEGKGYCEVCAPDFTHRCEDELEGAGLFNNIVASAKQFFSRAAKTVFTKTAEATTRAVRMDYPPKVRQYLAKNGAGVIQSITIQRTPINSMIDKALNFLTAGKFEEAKRKYAYDKLFHLSMVCIYMIDGRLDRVFIEKNEVIRMSETYTIQKDTQILPVPYEPGTLTLGDMMNKAAQMAGAQFFQYDAFTNNCQVFINTILDANKLNTPTVSAFVNQDAGAIVKELPEYVAPLARTLTNVAAIGDKAIEGSGEAKVVGTNVCIPKSDFKKEHIKLLGLLKPYKALGDEYDEQKKEMETLLGSGATHRENVLKKYELEDKPYSIAKLAKATSVPKHILQEVYNRGVGAYKTQPRSVRLKGSFVKNVDAPMSKKLSKEQWGMARVYSFLDGNPKHDNDLRANKGGRLKMKISAPPVLERNVISKNIGIPIVEDVAALLGMGKGLKKTKFNIDVQPVPKRKAIANRYVKQLVSLLQRGEIDLDEAFEEIEELEFSNAETEAMKADVERQFRDFAMAEGIAGEETESEDEAKEATGKEKSSYSGSGKRPIERQLAQLGITPAEYLASVRQSAKAYGIDPKDVELADDDSKIVVKGVKAGATGYGDYHIYKLLEAKGAAPPGTAEQHRKAYLARAMKIKGDWKKDKYSPNSLAVYVLWH